MKRRDFLKKSLLGAAALTVVPRHVLGGPGHTAPSDQLTKGIIGVGGMGRGHYGYAGTSAGGHLRCGPEPPRCRFAAGR
ncbi:MAG: twin-arginine translocation signal domain-containing protein [Alistipes indistinctus]